jgi:hypothetical protein
VFVSSLNFEPIADRQTFTPQEPGQRTNAMPVQEEMLGRSVT